MSSRAELGQTEELQLSEERASLSTAELSTIALKQRGIIQPGLSTAAGPESPDRSAATWRANVYRK